MAFNHLSGVTTPGAPDEIIDWFATFEAWMTGTCGWTVAAGGGTQDIYFNSLGELGGLTMLFVHVWRDLVNVNRVHLEVSDDIVPTHQTNEAGYVDSGGVQFAYWISADLDAIVVCFKIGAGYRTVYAGMVLPFALTITDETYCMIATSQQNQGSILRDFNNIWDVDHNLFDSDYMDDNMSDPLSGDLCLAGTYFNMGADIAGELKHVSCPIFDPGISAEDTIPTGYPGATTTWVVLEDHAARRYAMRTGGVLPVGVPPGAFGAALGVAATPAALMNAIDIFAVGLGWTSLGDPGWYDVGRLFYSTGESGQEEIYAGFSYELLHRFRPSVQDDAAGTHRTRGGILDLDDVVDFPLNYWLCGDLDCLMVAFQRAVGYSVGWAGLGVTFAPSLLAPPVQTPYNLMSAVRGQGGNLIEVLHARDGPWEQPAVWGFENVPANNSNPNAFDGVTYLIWPFHCDHTIGGWGHVPIGQLKYVGYSNGGGIANMDTITVAGEVWTVMFTNVGANFCIRTV